MDYGDSYAFEEHEIPVASGSSSFTVTWAAGSYESYSDSAAVFNPAGSATNFFGSGTVGVAPQLYCTLGCPQPYYGQYDNGANIFSFYDNFTGTSLSSKWSSTKGGTPPTVTVGNILTMATTTTGLGGIVSAATVAAPHWLDGLVTYATASASKEVGFEESTSATFGTKADDSGFMVVLNGSSSQYAFGKALSSGER